MTNVEARFNKSLRPRKPEGSLGRTAQDIHLDSHTAPELSDLAVDGLRVKYRETNLLAYFFLGGTVLFCRVNTLTPLHPPLSGYDYDFFVFLFCFLPCCHFVTFLRIIIISEGLWSSPLPPPPSAPSTMHSGSSIVSSEWIQS